VSCQHLAKMYFNLIFLAGTVAHTWNLSYLGSRDQKDYSLRPTQARSYGDPISRNKPSVVHNYNPSHVKGIVRWLQF
jgi:hypothetical protein